MYIICNSAPKVLKLNSRIYPSKKTNVSMTGIYFEIIVSESIGGVPIRNATYHTLC